jgi:hypothetical protein
MRSVRSSQSISSSARNLRRDATGRRRSKASLSPMTFAPCRIAAAEDRLYDNESAIRAGKCRYQEPSEARERHVSKRLLARVVPHVEPMSIRGIREADTRVWVGEAERSPHADRAIGASA